LPDLPDHRFHRYDLVKAQMAARDPMRGVLGAVQHRLSAGHTVWWVAGCHTAPADPIPASLPPAPRAASGWADIPYYRVWTRQVEGFLHRHARLQAPVQIALDQPVSRYECLTVRRFQQWQSESTDG